MNYGQYETERRLKSLSSKTGKYTSKLVFNIFKAFFILFLFLAVAGAAVGFGMIKGIIDNAQALCKGLLSRDIKIVSGGTDNHLMLVDLTNYDLTGKAVEKACQKLIARILEIASGMLEAPVEELVFASDHVEWPRSSWYCSCYIKRHEYRRYGQDCRGNCHDG